MNRDDQTAYVDGDEVGLNLPAGLVIGFKVLRALVAIALIAAVVVLAIESEWVWAIVVVIATPFVLGLFEAVFLVWPGSAWMWLRNRKKR